MRASLCFVGASLVFGVLGCNELFGVGAPEPLPGAAGAGGTGGAGMTANPGGGGAGGDNPSTGSTTTSTTGLTGPCGNGMLDVGEACDPADPDTGAKCTSICTVASVLQIAAGAAHTCVLLEGGQVKCWGLNANGELGLADPVGAVGDAPGEMGKALQPVDLGTGEVATAIAAGANHTCALLAGGRVKCWGQGSAGQLGQGDTKSRGDAPGEMGDALPVIDLGANAEVVEIAAGSQHTCARFKNANVKCWGKNEHGQIGAGDLTTLTLGDEPDEMGDALLVAAGGVIQIAAGDFHTCGRFDDGAVRCWGYNKGGQLGVGDTMDYGNPMKVPPVMLPGAAARLWAGGAQTCALLMDGPMYCWGENAYGQLGVQPLLPMGDQLAEVGNFPEVLLDSAPAALAEWAMGGQHTCATFPAFGVKCWGRNNYGQLGLGASLPNTTEPPAKSEVANIGLGIVPVVGSGAFHACAFAQDKGLRCWGRNHVGQLGLGSTEDVGIDPAGLGASLPVVRMVSDTW